MMKNNQFNKNLLICGDNLKALDDLNKQGIKADLIYLDPPFFSNRHYEVVWGDEAEVRSFKDRWAGGIKVYIEWMKERVVKIYDVLKDTGSFYFHCDWHASHYLKTMLDEVFGYRNFRNEIVWHYAIGGKSGKQWGRKHDTIFFYTKTNKWIFNEDEIRLPFTPHKRSRTGHYGGRMGVDEEGKAYVEKWGTGKKKLYRYYLDKGKIPEDVWSDIQTIQPAAKERLGYPTQKPEALLERIIKASSKKESIVLDPFCGCGTAMAVAHRLNRKWIGIDISPTAISLIEKRLEKIGAVKRQDFDSIGMPTTLSELTALEPFEFQNWVVNEMRAKQSKKLVGDMGLNGYYDKTIFTEEAGIQVKQSEKVGRNVVFNFETALRAGKYKKGYIIAFSFTKGTHEEVARAKGDGLDIKLIRVEDLLLGKIKI